MKMGSADAYGHDNVVVFAAAAEILITVTQSHLRFPANIDNMFRQAFLPLLHLGRDFCRETIAVRTFDQQSSGATITGFGDAAQASFVTAAIFAWCQSDIGHQLVRLVEPGKVTQFCNQPHRNQKQR